MTRVSALFIACLGLAVPNASPRSHSGPTMDDWTFIATVGGVDGITHTHLEQLLNGHHIESLIEGSIVYGVSVPTDKKAEAIKLIKDDLRERRYDITLYEDGKKTT